MRRGDAYLTIDGAGCSSHEDSNWHGLARFRQCSGRQCAEMTRSSNIDLSMYKIDWRGLKTSSKI